MVLKRFLSAAALAAVLAGSAWLAQDASANFADAAGFSGRAGATCIACHTEAPFPLNPPPATAVLEGLPAAWDAGATYRLTIRVEGGPPALPAPAPQGGFDIAFSHGLVGIPTGFEDLIRAPNPQEVTYHPAGTLMREWQMDWTAPDLAGKPGTVQVWLAVVSANGNHVIATNTSDGGERFDASAHLTALVPPSSAAEQAWRDLPLAAPVLRIELGDPRSFVHGNQTDGNATAIAWRLDGGAWQERDAGPEWRVRLDDLAPGSHRFEARSLGADRQSPVVALDFEVPGFTVPFSNGRDAPAPPVALLALALFSLAFVRLRR
jgi:hypothetical protein